MGAQYSQMKAIAPHDRPREKLDRLGVGALGDHELVALVLGTGDRDTDALALATSVLAHVDGVLGLTRVSAAQLRHVRGIGRARSAQLLAAIELGRRTLVREAAERPLVASPARLAAYLLPQYGAHAVEQFGIVLLDTKRRIIRIRVLTIGSLDSTVVHPREVFREAAAHAASAIVLFHNHPSGDPTPSADDMALTERLVQAGQVMGIDVLDHIVLSAQRYYSLSEAGGLSRPSGKMIGP